MGNTELVGSLEWLTNLVVGLTTDFLGFIVIAAVVAAFAFYFGRDRLVTLIAGLYAAIPLYIAFPYQDFLTTPLLSVALYFFLVIVGVIAFSGLSAFMASGSLGFVKMLLISGITAGMVIAISIHILPVESFYSFSEPTKALFVSSEAFFLWLLAPLIGLYFLGR